MSARDEDSKDRFRLSAETSFTNAVSISTKSSERKQTTKLILNDLRIFLNSLNYDLTVMNQGGIDAVMDQTETETDLILTINISKTITPF